MAEGSGDCRGGVFGEDEGAGLWSENWKTGLDIKTQDGRTDRCEGYLLRRAD